jgi:hypothetical protein
MVRITRKVAAMMRTSLTHEFMTTIYAAFALMHIHILAIQGQSTASRSRVPPPGLESISKRPPNVPARCFIPVKPARTQARRDQIRGHRFPVAGGIG